VRTICLLLLLMACSGSSSEPPPAVAATRALQAAVADWQANPDAANLDAVGLAAAEAQTLPPGDRDLDLALGAALADVLLRPDLAARRLEPLVPSLTAAEADAWLDALLRGGDLQRLAEEITRLHAHPIDPAQEGLVAAAAQSRTHRIVDWRAAVRAHDASALASRQVMYDRKRLDRPVRDSLPDAVDALIAALPGWHLAMVTTRSIMPTEPVVDDTPGAIPASGGKRLVVGYADRDPDQVRAVARALVDKRPSRVVGIVISAWSDDHRELTLCGEGRFEDGQLWLVSGCGPARESTWLDAAEAWRDLGAAGVPDAERARKVATDFGPRLAAP
jgi:hypothetical protein